MEWVTKSNYNWYYQYPYWYNSSVGSSGTAGDLSPQITYTNQSNSVGSLSKSILCSYGAD